MTRTILARLVVAILLGLVVGYGVGKSLAHDAERGRTLTMKEYVSEFDNHKKQLAGSGSPMAATIVVGVLMTIVMFGVYELLVLAVDKGLAALDRRRNDAPQPGTPPPW